MRTEQLIDDLAKDVKPVGRRAVGMRLLAGMILGALASAALVAMTLGVRPDLGTAMTGHTFWMKWSYTLSLSLIAIYATARLARPDPGRLRAVWLACIPIGLLMLVGLFEMMHTPPRDWLAMWLGKSWRECPWIVLLLAMPIFIGLLWSFRRLAPTRLRAAGAAAGLAAGAFAATVYCLHCPEVSALFVLTWYSLGIVLAAGIGALLGPRLLRW